MAYSTIDKSSEHFNPVTYTGNGTTQSITGINFQPDFVWVKSRGFGEDHQLTDSVRGATKVIQSNLTDAESTMTGGLTAFNADGFSVGNQSDFNYNNDALVSWNWKAGGTASSNTDGSITSSVSANTTNGFSVVTYTGTGANATIGHGLGSVPKMILLKNIASAENWITGHNSNGWTKYQSLNTTDATSTASNIWQDTAPTSSVFSIGASGKVNGSSNGMVAYCFADVKGFSKFGSYVGNGNADGTFVYTGFKPAFVIYKRTNGTGFWGLVDSVRTTADGNDGTPPLLQPNATTTESAIGGWGFNLLSNGFKQRETDSNVNGSGDTYVYMAFAEAPLVGSNNVPANAR